MKVKLAPGKYVLAVSGGVDSVTLLDLLAKKKGLELVVAHFDHGIRGDSAKDADFVKKLAADYSLKFEHGWATLGADVSEEKARAARYTFLKSVVKSRAAKALITAHHQDDLIETAFLNLLRGTGPRGLISMAANVSVIRPLLNYSRSQIEDYANINDLKWREDPTNQDERYLRNYIRHNLMPRLTSQQRKQVIVDIDKIASSQALSNKLIATLLHIQEGRGKIDRTVFSKLDSKTSAELLHAKYRDLGDINQLTIDRLNAAIRTAKAGRRINIVKDYYLVLDKQYAWLESRAD